MMKTKLTEDARNHANLTSLWRAFGADPIEGLEHKEGFISNAWPWRAWLGMHAAPTVEDFEVIDRARDGHSVMLPLWGAHIAEARARLKRFGYAPVMRQTAMALDLREAGPLSQRFSEVEVVDTPDLLGPWTTTASEAFGYPVDLSPQERLFEDPAAKFFVWRNLEGDGEVGGTGLMYGDGEVGGVHMVGVSSRFRRRGIARAIMTEILAWLQTHEYALVTLQASDAGLHLYETLGFVGDTVIETYRSPGSTG